MFNSRSAASTPNSSQRNLLKSSASSTGLARPASSLYRSANGNGSAKNLGRSRKQSDAKSPIGLHGQPRLDPTQRTFDAVLNFVPHGLQEKMTLKGVILVTTVSRSYLVAAAPLPQTLVGSGRSTPNSTSSFSIPKLGDASRSQTEPSRKRWSFLRPPVVHSASTDGVAVTSRQSDSASLRTQADPVSRHARIIHVLPAAYSQHASISSADSQRSNGLSRLVRTIETFVLSVCSHHPVDTTTLPAHSSIKMNVDTKHNPATNRVLPYLIPATALSDVLSINTSPFQEDARDDTSSARSSASMSSSEWTLFDLVLYGALDPPVPLALNTGRPELGKQKATPFPSRAWVSGVYDITVRSPWPQNPPSPPRHVVQPRPDPYHQQQQHSHAQMQHQVHPPIHIQTQPQPQPIPIGRSRPHHQAYAPQMSMSNGLHSIQEPPAGSAPASPAGPRPPVHVPRQSLDKPVPPTPPELEQINTSRRMSRSDHPPLSASVGGPSSSKRMSNPFASVSPERDAPIHDYQHQQQYRERSREAQAHHRPASQRRNTDPRSLHEALGGGGGAGDVQSLHRLPTPPEYVDAPPNANVNGASPIMSPMIEQQPSGAPSTLAERTSISVSPVELVPASGPVSPVRDPTEKLPAVMTGVGSGYRLSMQMQSTPNLPGVVGGAPVVANGTGEGQRKRMSITRSHSYGWPDTNVDGPVDPIGAGIGGGGGEEYHVVVQRRLSGSGRPPAEPVHLNGRYHSTRNHRVRAEKPRYEGSRSRSRQSSLDRGAQQGRGSGDLANMALADVPVQSSLPTPPDSFEGSHEVLPPPLMNGSSSGGVRARRTSLDGTATATARQLKHVRKNLSKDMYAAPPPQVVLQQQPQPQPPQHGSQLERRDQEANSPSHRDAGYANVDDKRLLVQRLRSGEGHPQERVQAPPPPPPEKRMSKGMFVAPIMDVDVMSTRDDRRLSKLTRKPLPNVAVDVDGRGGQFSPNGGEKKHAKWKFWK